MDCEQRQFEKRVKNLKTMKKYGMEAGRGEEYSNFYGGISDEALMDIKILGDEGEDVCEVEMEEAMPALPNAPSESFDIDAIDKQIEAEAKLTTPDHRVTQSRGVPNKVSPSGETTSTSSSTTTTSIP